MPKVTIEKVGNHCEVDPGIFHAKANPKKGKVRWMNKTKKEIHIYFPNYATFFGTTAAPTGSAAFAITGKGDAVITLGKKGTATDEAEVDVEGPPGFQYYQVFCDETGTFAHGGGDDPGGSNP